jgi:hypothetical protein
MSEGVMDGVDDVYMCIVPLHGWCGKRVAGKAVKEQYSMHMQCEG